MPLRPISIANRHPRLRLDRRAVARAIHLLDAEFSPAPAAPVAGARAQISNLKSPRPTTAAAPQSRIENRKSKILPTCPPGELSLVFLTDAALAQLHADFLDDPTTTDVITFEGDPAAGVAGEVCVSVDTAAAYAKKHRRDFSEELTLYIIHGWLHLAGYDDLQPAKKRVMRRAERRSLQILHLKAGCVPHFILR